MSPLHKFIPKYLSVIQFFMCSSQNISQLHNFGQIWVSLFQPGLPSCGDPRCYGVNPVSEHLNIIARRFFSIKTQS